jgi:acetyltransferase-like isoleucine patch superfamily enzyme
MGRSDHDGKPKGGHGTPLERLLTKYVRPIARKVIYSAVEPPKPLRPLYSAAFDAQFLSREAYEFARRSLIATPVFLARCAKHGERIAVDRIPYMTGPCRIELGSDIRISGQINISGSSYGKPLLKIGNGVFIGHACGFDIADRIEIGNFVSIGAMTYIADTEGHSHYNPQRPIWEVLASPDDIAPVILEDGVQISKRCMILKGVRIGARSVIGAGSVVRSDIPPDSIVMGNPARVVKRMVATPDAKASAS